MKPELRRALTLFALTLVSMFWVGNEMRGADPAAPWWQSFVDGSILQGYPFALPLMAILLAHELGHYFAARLHAVETSPPYFIPFPYALIGTFGAVIRMRGAIRTRNALFDIGAAGPLCGLVVALPVLIYGLATSPVRALDPAETYLVEGRSLLYLGVLHALKGSIAQGYDVMLTPTAFAGWAGLLVTMMNLVPTGQLDGGHVAYALFGPRQLVYSVRVRWGLLGAAGVVMAVSGATAVESVAVEEPLARAVAAGMHWMVWWGVLTFMARLTREEHPPTEPSQLSPVRRRLAMFTLLLFVVLFMPTWIREG